MTVCTRSIISCEDLNGYDVDYYPTQSINKGLKC